MPRSSTIFAYYSSFEIHRVSTNRKNPELPKSNLTRPEDRFPTSFIRIHNTLMSTSDLTNDKNDRSISSSVANMKRSISLKTSITSPEIDFTPYHTNLCLDSSLFILSLLCLLFVYQSPLCLRYIALQFQGSLNFTENWNIHIRGFELANLRQRFVKSVRAPSNTVDHAHIRVRSYEIKACICNPGLYHGYTCRSDLHIISKSVNTGHGSDFHSRMALSRSLLVQIPYMRILTRGNC